MLASRILQLDSIQIQRRENEQSDPFVERVVQWMQGRRLESRLRLSCGSVLGQDVNPSSSVWECVCSWSTLSIIKVLQSSTVAQSMCHLIFIFSCISPQNHVGCLKAPLINQTVGSQITGRSNNSLGPHLEAANWTWDFSRWSITSCRCSRCVDDAELWHAVPVRAPAWKKIIQDLL